MFKLRKEKMEKIKKYSVAVSDVKFHDVFCSEIFHEICLKYLKKIHDVFFRLYTHPFNIVYTSNITFHSFMHTAAP